MVLARALLRYFSARDTRSDPLLHLALEMTYSAAFAARVEGKPLRKEALRLKLAKLPIAEADTGAGFLGAENSHRRRCGVFNVVRHNQAPSEVLAPSLNKPAQAMRCSRSMLVRQPLGLTR